MEPITPDRNLETMSDIEYIARDRVTTTRKLRRWESIIFHYSFISEAIMNKDAILEHYEWIASAPIQEIVDWAKSA